MTDDTRRIAELVSGAVDTIEPADRLAEIRAATRRSTRPRAWAVATAVLGTAAVLAAIAFASGRLTTGAETSPAGPGPSGESSPASTETTVAVYYVGDTPQGPRLYREFRRLAGDPLTSAVNAALGRDADGRPLAALDPDYRSAWPALTTASTRLVPDGADRMIEISLGGDPESDLRDPGDLEAEEAGLAVEQLVWTAQAAVGERLPVQFLLFGERTDRLLGVAVSEPVANGPLLQTLARVSLTSPEEAATIDNDRSLAVSGVANVYEGTVLWRLTPATGGAEPVAEGFFTAGWGEDRLFPFTGEVDLTGVPPGDYVLTAQESDASGGEGPGPPSDDRLVVVVE